jgi:hypothetical protein
MDGPTCSHKSQARMARPLIFLLVRTPAQTLTGYISKQKFADQNLEMPKPGKVRFLRVEIYVPLQMNNLLYNRNCTAVTN